MRSKTKHKTPAGALDNAAIRRLALRYVERYATSSTKLRHYLERKLAESRRNADADLENSLDISAVVQECVDAGYINDQSFADMRSRTLVRKGFGPRRIEQELNTQRLGDAATQDARDEARENAWVAARNFARRKRIGPFASKIADPDLQRKQFQAFLRAGHDSRVARVFVSAAPGDEPEQAE